MTLSIIILLFLLIGVLVGLSFLGKQGYSSQISRMIQEGKYEKAILLLKQEIKRDPNNIKALSLLADCYAHMGDHSGALAQYLKIKQLDLASNLEEKVKLYNKIAGLYNQMKQYENSLEMSLQIVMVYPEDYDANKIIAYALLGEGKFNLAISYLKKILMIYPDDKQVQTAYNMALFYTGQKDEALESMKNLADQNPNDIDLNFLFIAMHQKKKFREGIEYVMKIFDQTQNEDMKKFLVRLLCYFIYCLKPQDEPLEYLKKYMNDIDTLVQVRRECHYFYILFMVQMRNTKLAEDLIRDFENSYRNYRNLEKLKASIGTQHTPFKEIVDFSSFYKKEFESLIPDDLLFNISGLKIDHSINLDKFFNFTDESNPILREEFQIPTLESLLEKYYYLSNDAFLKFTQKACAFFNLKIGSHTKNPDGNSLDYICVNEQTKEKVLASFVQYKGTSSLSEILINDLVDRGEDCRAQKIILVTNGKFTEAAEEAAVSIDYMNILKDKELCTLFLNTLNY